MFIEISLLSKYLQKFYVIRPNLYKTKTGKQMLDKRLRELRELLQRQVIAHSELNTAYFSKI
jgi:hypothetical protein